jgi:hypothetical protein
MTMVILSDKDIQKVHSILAAVAKKDRRKIHVMKDVRYLDEESFWQSIVDLPVTLVKPPKRFFGNWNFGYSPEKKILSMEGPVWTKEQGCSDAYLYIDRRVTAKKLVYVIKAIYVP